jgi:hypothetical protein
MQCKRTKRQQELHVRTRAARGYVPRDVVNCIVAALGHR